MHSESYAKSILHLFTLHLDTAALAPESKTLLKSLAVDARLDKLHRHTEILNLKVSVFVVEE